MKVSKLLFRTLKEAPSDAETISHQLLERGGYIQKLSKGLFIYNTLMWRVLKKLSNVIREELDKAGAQEISMPMMHPKELWDKTGRWDDFRSANLLYTLKDREDHEYCISPTAEEVVVYLASQFVTSYKQLPLNLYQIGSKFRDEIRPRFGLMRCKEFIMKDGYSFSATIEEMDNQYLLMREAYSSIFRRLGLDFAIVEAHGGKIGNSKSEEFQVRADVGEDAVMVCGDYASNVEMAIAIPPEFTYDKALKEKYLLETPKVKSIEELCKRYNFAPHQILKTIVFKLVFADREELVAIGIRGDRQVNAVKVQSKFGALEIELASDEEIKEWTDLPPGFIGPIAIPIPFFADKTAAAMTNFVCGANKEDHHHGDVNWKKDCAEPEFFDFLTAQEGDGCPIVPGGVYKIQRGIEVGHIFNLFTKYSEKLGANFQNEEGKIQPCYMGTYGIGVGRTAAAVVEQKHDEKGIIWPMVISPFRVTVTAALTKDEQQVSVANEIYQELLKQGYDPLYDDRNERIGFKMKDSDLIGIPYKLIVGRAFAEQGKLEIETRAGEKTLIDRAALRDWAKENLSV